MTRDEMAEVMLGLQMSEERLRQEGQKEYAHSEDNAFANFERVGKMLNLPREKVLMVYLLKHIDGIIAWVNGHRSQREDVSGRIGDARVYLALLMGMALEDDGPYFPTRFDEETDYDRAD